MAAGREALDAARELLDKRLKVTVPDGRILTGHFSCLDKQGNLVLSRTTQVSSLGTERFLGVVVVPSRQRVRCELE
jgi:small nuclear ribonucleoprotein (snRNP)-like protein